MAQVKFSISIVSLPFYEEAPVLGSLLYSLLIEYLKKSTASGDASLAVEIIL